MKGGWRLDIIDVEKVVEERRFWLQGHLEMAADSLRNPPTAQRIRELFRPLLDTCSGHIALLFAVCRYLWIVDEGSEYEALGVPLRALGTDVINRL